jgi:hypothetical protein
VTTLPPPETVHDVMALLDRLDEDEREEVVAAATEATAGQPWLPNPGPQTAAYFSIADETFYGGAAGGGKSALLCGLALTQHKRSILFRREFPQVKGLVDEIRRIIGHRSGYNATTKVWRLADGREIEFGSVPNEDDVEKYQGRPHDLVGFDEITHFSEAQYRFLIGWNRSAEHGQRCRIVAAGNPPTSSEGFWVIKRWAPWLDETHPNPAKPGELRWFTTIDGRDVECAGPEPILVNGEKVRPRSRTFIRSKLSDNPDLAASGYDATLAAMPAELRAALRDGVFDASQKDVSFQVIPSEWIRAAQARWTERPPEHVGMSVLAHDVALGGGDANTFARRHGHWYDKVISKKLKGLVDPIDLAMEDIALMRDGCPVVIDMGGGYGSGVYSHLKHNVQQIKLHGFNGSEASGKRTRDGKLTFKNKRAEVWWKFREALEPGLGEPVCLPPDAELLADLAAPTWKLTPQGILIEEKAAIRARLGRSPDKGDAVVLAWSYGEDSVTARIRVAANPRGTPRVNVGYATQKAGRSRPVRSRFAGA